MLDVTDVLVDSDFCQTITALNRTKQASITNGKTVVTDTQLINVKGVIQPTKEDIFEQYPQLDRTKEHITIWTTTPFTVGVTIVTWRSNDYLVRVVKDWRDYTATVVNGFQRSIAERMQLVKQESNG